MDARKSLAQHFGLMYQVAAANLDGRRHSGAREDRKAQIFERLDRRTGDGDDTIARFQSRRIRRAPAKPLP